MATSKFTIKVSIFNRRRGRYEDITEDVLNAVSEGDAAKKARLIGDADSIFINCAVADLDEALERLKKIQTDYHLEDLGGVEKSVSPDGRRGSASLKRGGTTLEALGL